MPRNFYRFSKYCRSKTASPIKLGRVKAKHCRIKNRPCLLRQRWKFIV